MYGHSHSTATYPIGTSSTDLVISNDSYSDIILEYFIQGEDSHLIDVTTKKIFQEEEVFH